MMKIQSTKNTVSIVINFHKEGYLAQSTIKSARQARKHLESRGIASVEAIAVLDHPDAITRQVIEKNRDFFDRIDLVTVRDLAAARNHGVQIATGDYVAFLDGDDMWGESWLTGAYTHVQTFDEPVVLHTEYFIGFGRENFSRLQWDSADPNFDPLTLMQNWHFCNNSFASRKLLLANPYVSYDHESGFGSEDWHWSCETIARGIRHTFVPKTAYFYRMRQDILAIGGNAHLGLGAKPGLLVRPSALFMPGSIGFQRKKKLIQDIFVTDGIRASNELMGTPLQVCESVRAEWTKVGHIDPDCFPTRAVIDANRIFRADIHYSLARLYRKIVSKITAADSFVFIEQRNHRESVIAANHLLSSTMDSSKNIAVILMSDVTLVSDELEEENFSVIPLWKMCIVAGIGGNEIATLITRLILQVQPKQVVNLWSSFLMDAVLKPYNRAFDTLGIKVVNTLYSTDNPDLFEPRFRKEWSDSLQIMEKNVHVKTASLAAVPYLNRRIDLNHCHISSVVGTNEMSDTSTVTFSLPDEVKISCVLNVHRERFILYPTLKSIATMLDFTAGRDNIGLELVVVLDRSDEQTSEIIREFCRNLAVPSHVINVQLGDLALARNAGVSAANGEYIALLDADDLYCSDWLSRALSTCEAHETPEQIVMHPQFNFYFGANTRVFEHQPMSAGDAAQFTLGFTNLWTSLAFAHRNVFLEHPFKALAFEQGFAFEDWTWNIGLLKSGISHCVALGTSHYIRLKQHGSLNSRSVDAGAIFRPSGLFKE
jgi:glycosyltransferase involved in cell wall biosynthesis